MRSVSNHSFVTNRDNSEKKALNPYAATHGLEGRKRVAEALGRQEVRALTSATWAAGTGPVRHRERVRQEKETGRWIVSEYDEFVIPTRFAREAEALGRAKRAYVNCCRNFLYHECLGPETHSSLTPRHCGLATICPECAARESGRLKARYRPRIATAMVTAANGLRLRFLTFGVRPHGTEALSDAFSRCMPAGKSLLRVCYGVPVSAQEWAAYWEGWPLSGWEINDAGSKAKAKKARRQKVRATRTRQGYGAVLTGEFGEQGMKAHCHALVLGHYVAQPILSRVWRKLTGDSHVVHVEAANLDSVGEVLKYAVKFADRTPEQLADIYRAMCGRRRVESMGCFRGACDLEQWDAWLRDKPTCDVCGAERKAVGQLPHWMHAMGLRAPPNDRPYRWAFVAPRAGAAAPARPARAVSPQIGLPL